MSDIKFPENKFPIIEAEDFDKNTKKEDRLEKYKALLKFRNIPFEADLFTWHNDDL